MFPDGELVTPGELVSRAEAVGFETRDLESLREHYACTLRCWVANLEAHWDEAVREAEAALPEKPPTEARAIREATVPATETTKGEALIKRVGVKLD